MSWTKTYSKSSDFGGSFNAEQFQSEVNADVGVTPTVTYIMTAGDVIDVVFDAEVTGGELTTLAGLVTAHVPATPNTLASPYIEPGTSIVKHDINGSTYSLLGSQSNEIHISKETQGHYSTIKAAVTANNSSNIVFIVHPGNYSEDNPITLPTGCVLTSAGHAENTTITAANTTSDIIVCGIGCKIQGFTIIGATGTGARGLYFDGSLSGGYGKFSAIMECFIKNCDIGIEVDGNSGGGAIDVLYAREMLVMPTSQSLTKGIYCHSAGHLISASVQVVGVPGYFTITDGIHCTGTASKVSMTTSSSWDCTTGLRLDDGGEAELQLMTMKNNTNGVIIGSTGTTTRLSANSMEIKNSTTYDLDVQASDAVVEIHSMVVDITKINNPNNVTINIRYSTKKDGKKYQGMLGEIHVGSVAEPSKMQIGEGGYDVGTITYLTNDNLEAGTWTDVTASANSFDNSTFNLFSGTAAGNCLYIGRSVNPVGAKFDVTTATTSVTAASDVVWEYWDGSAWTAFCVMQTDASDPHYFVTDCFVSSVAKTHVRFGIKSNTALANKTLNGFDRRWVRARVVNTLSSIPVAEYIKAHTHNVKFNSDGYNEYFGNSRPIKKLEWEFHATYGANTVPGDQDLYISKALGASLKGNSFPDSALTRIGLVSYVPSDIDTSFPITFQLSFVCDTTIAGDVEFVVRYDIANAGDSVYTSAGSAPTNTANEKSASVIKSVTTAQILYSATITANVDSINPNPSSGVPGIIWFTIERDAQVGNTNDTYTGNVSILQFYPRYIAWNDGIHLLSL